MVDGILYRSPLAVFWLYFTLKKDQYRKQMNNFNLAFFILFFLAVIDDFSK